MDTCVQCRTPLDGGRFCTSCGHPVGLPAGESWRTDTAERRPALPGVTDQPTVLPTAAGRHRGEATVVPPPVYTTPPPARFPLYADEVPPADVVTDQTPAWLAGAAPAPRQPRRGLLVWVVGAATLLVAAGLGGFLLLGGSGTASDGTTPRVDPTPVIAATSHPASTPAAPTGASPSAKPHAGPHTRPHPKPKDVARSATVVAPRSAPPALDVHGHPVRYVAANLLDGAPATAWRMVGDGSGSTIVLTLKHPTLLTSVGLVNGYAKQEPGYDGYHANRRITAVRWSFDDGSSVSQSLRGTREMQSVDVAGVTTRTVRLEILSVTVPVRGTSERDYTAISDVALVGTAA